MTEVWREVVLSDVVTRMTKKNVGGAIENVLTVSARHGLIAQDKFFTRKVASSDTSKYYVVEPGQFVYNKSTTKEAPYGTVARNLDGEPGIVSPIYFVFEAHTDDVLPEYLELALNSRGFFASLSGMLRAGARSHGLLNVRLDEFYGAKLAVPPLPVQARIVDVIGAVDDQIIALDAEAAALASAGQRALDLRYQAMVEGLESQPLESLLETKLTYGVVQPGPEVDVGAPLIRAQDFSDGTVRIEGLRKISAALDEEYRRSRVKAGDILIVLVGKTGPVVVVPPALDGANIARAIGRLRFDSGKVDVAYMVAALNTSAIQATLQVATHTTVQPTLNLKELKDLRVAVPSSAEQEALARQWASTLRAMSALKAEADRLRAVRASLLAALLDRQIAITDAERTAA